ncbi:hypothetical protein [Acidithiobacillus ferriphilus]|uniref:hypothetical protein n=1 Tax=Acidithiobacillus ferriphilus TaxID=1689834 RepID=UPI002DBB6C30|nr:hypothetical protein [Acidithiobacillus ferriphilus]
MSDPAFWLCVSNVDYEVSLEPLKVYEGMPDPEAQWSASWRVRWLVRYAVTEPSTRR